MGDLIYTDIINKEGGSIPAELVLETETVSIKTPVSKALALLSKYPAIIVNKNGEYYGIMDSRSIYKARSQLKFQKNQTIERYVDRAPKLEKNTPIDEVLLTFYRARAKALPFVDNGKIIGIFDRSTLLKMMLSLKMLNGIKINEAMSTPVIAVNDMVDISQAKTVMENNRISRVIVLHDGRFAGLLTYFTLIKNYSIQNEALPEFKSSKYSPRNINISEVMEKNPKLINEERELPQAARDMIEHDISSLVVANNRDAPIGMLTFSDILEITMARRRIEDNRIFTSGFDEESREYEQEIRDELKAFVSKIESRDLKVEYVFMHLKRLKGRKYDIKMRVSIKNRNIISAHITDFLLERTFREAITLLKRDIIKEKEKILNSRRSNDKWRLIE